MIVDSTPWKTVSLMGAHQTGVLSVLVDHDKKGDERLWVGPAGDGLGLYENNQWRYFNKTGGELVNATVTMIARADDPQRRPAAWLGTDSGPLMHVSEGPEFDPVATPWPQQPGQRLNDMLSRRVDGAVKQWFATDASGVYCLRNGIWTAFHPQAAVGTWSVQKLLAQTTAYGHAWLWATSNQGVARFDGKQWELFGRDIGLPGSDLLGIQLIPDARKRPILWLGSIHHGIIRVDIIDPLHPRALPADLPPALDFTADGALADTRGRIYVCTDSGVQQLIPDAVRYRSQVFTVRDGMVNNECNPDAQFIDTQGRFWAGTLSGLMVHDSNQKRPDHDAKPVTLLQVRVDDKPVRESSVTIPPGHHELRVDFALLSWRHEDESRFHTWIEGFSNEPRAWTTDNFREIGALPPGDYVLHIEGRDYAGNLSTPILLPVIIEPSWWQRPWAWLLFTAGAILVIYELWRWRTHPAPSPARAGTADRCAHSAVEHGQPTAGGAFPPRCADWRVQPALDDGITEAQRRRQSSPVTRVADLHRREPFRGVQRHPGPLGWRPGAALGGRDYRQMCASRCHRGSLRR